MSKTSREQLLAKIDATQSAEKESPGAQLRAQHRGEWLFLSGQPKAVEGDGGSWQRFSLCTTPGLHPSSSQCTYLGTLAGWRASAGLPRSCHPAASHCHHQLHLLLPGMPSLAVAQRGVKKQSNHPHCAGC